MLKKLACIDQSVEVVEMLLDFVVFYMFDGIEVAIITFLLILNENER